MAENPLARIAKKGAGYSPIQDRLKKYIETQKRMTQAIK